MVQYKCTGYVHCTQCNTLWTRVNKINTCNYTFKFSLNPCSSVATTRIHRELFHRHNYRSLRVPHFKSVKTTLKVTIFGDSLTVVASMLGTHNVRSCFQKIIPLFSKWVLQTSLRPFSMTWQSVASSAFN